MDKYQLLFVLNIGFVFFGFLKALMAYRTRSVDRLTFLFRTIFWAIILLVLIFAHPIYDYLFRHNLTDSSPLSLPDVVLATGVMLCLSLCIRLYSKVETLDKRLSDIHEKLSIQSSEHKD
jgi:hypothetical protein